MEGNNLGWYRVASEYSNENRHSKHHIINSVIMYARDSGMNANISCILQMGAPIRIQSKELKDSTTVWSHFFFEYPWENILNSNIAILSEFWFSKFWHMFLIFPFFFVPYDTKILKYMIYINIHKHRT